VTPGSLVLQRAHFTSDRKLYDHGLTRPFADTDAVERNPGGSTNERGGDATLNDGWGNLNDVYDVIHDRSPRT
jgi:hypothetical protein